MRTWTMMLGLMMATATLAEAKPVKEANLPRSVPTVAVGDPVPDLPLIEADGTPVALATQLTPGRPLVLIFGSFT
ncbi:MAG: hypothetical protein H0V89_12700 [Deltaproteobacteria bacterium]|nr:hypothetical protein [Deltaproteobacteria bacterium]